MTITISIQCDDVHKAAEILAKLGDSAHVSAPTATVGGQAPANVEEEPTVKKGKSRGKKDTAPAAEPKPEANLDVRGALMELGKSQGMDAVGDVLTRCGVRRVSEIVDPVLQQKAIDLINNYGK